MMLLTYLMTSSQWPVLSLSSPLEVSNWDSPCKNGVFMRTMTTKTQISSTFAYSNLGHCPVWRIIEYCRIYQYMQTLIRLRFCNVLWMFAIRQRSKTPYTVAWLIFWHDTSKLYLKTCDVPCQKKVLWHIRFYGATNAHGILNSFAV